MLPQRSSACTIRPSCLAASNPAPELGLSDIAGHVIGAVQLKIRGFKCVSMAWRTYMPGPSQPQAHPKQPRTTHDNRPHTMHANQPHQTHACLSLTARRMRRTATSRPRGPQSWRRDHGYGTPPSSGWPACASIARAPGRWSPCSSVSPVTRQGLARVAPLRTHSPPPTPWPATRSCGSSI